MNEGKTLVFNEKIIDGWTEEYDYNRELGKTKLKPEIKEKVKDNNLTESKIGEFFTIVLWIIGIFLLVGITTFLVYHLKLGSLKKKPVEIPEEDTIYGIDFEALILQMEKEGNYMQCIRLKYLSVLRTLHDSHRIAWEPYKTPTQYVYEMKNVDFKTLTNLFMKVRYGGYAATIQMYDEAKRLSDLVLKGGRG